MFRLFVAILAGALLFAGAVGAEDVILDPDIDGAIAAVHGDPAAREALEAECIAVLSADTPYTELYPAIRILTAIASEKSVAPLAALLDDANVSHHARYVLETVPYEAAGQALRDALATTTGAQRLGVIASVAYRRDGAAVPALAALLDDADMETAVSAAYTLGHIASPEAVQALRKLKDQENPELRLAGAKGTLAAARHIQGDEGAILFEELFAPEMPGFIRTGAFTGLVAAQPEQALSRVVAAIQGEDELLQLTAIASLSTLDVAETPQRLAELLPTLASDRKALVIEALAERDDPAALPLLHEVLNDDNEEVRLAAMRAIAAHGDSSSIAPVYQIIAQSERRQERMAAVETLRRLQGDDVDAALIEHMTNAPEEMRAPLMEALAGRNAVTAVDAIIEQTKHESLRPAAFRALGHLAPSERLPDLIALLSDLKGDRGRSDAESAVVALCQNMARASDHIESTRPVVNALGEALENAAAPEEAASLMRVLSRLGGDAAYQLVIARLDDPSPEVRDSAARALANWPDAQAAPALIDIFAQASDTGIRMATLRGCVRLLRLGELPVNNTLQHYEQLVETTRTDDERRLILAGLADVSAPEAIPLVIALLEDADVQAEADMALQRIEDATGMTAEEMEAAKKAAATTASASDASGFEAIFNGESLDGWAGDPAFWRVEDGHIVGESTRETPVEVNTFLIWEGGEPADFELKFRYRLDSESANTGIQIRSERFEDYRVRGYQPDIASDDWITGICYEEGGRGILARRGQKVELAPDGEKEVTQFADEDELGAHINVNDWNDYHVIARGDRFMTRINGHKMHEVIDNSPEARTSGILAFQLHTGPPMKIRFADIMLKELAAE